VAHGWGTMWDLGAPKQHGEGRGVWAWAVLTVTGEEPGWGHADGSITNRDQDRSSLVVRGSARSNLSVHYLPGVKSKTENWFAAVSKPAPQRCTECDLPTGYDSCTCLNRVCYLLVLQNLKVFYYFLI
jgi:hypothetical protein